MAYRKRTNGKRTKRAKQMTLQRRMARMAKMTRYMLGVNNSVTNE